MAIDFLTKSRHGTIYYFRRRVPKQLHEAIGKALLIKSLETSERRLAVIRARSLAAQSDLLFQRMFMTMQTSSPNGFSIDLIYKLDLPRLGTLTIDAKPEEQDALDAAIRTTIEAAASLLKAVPAQSTSPDRNTAFLAFSEAIAEYYLKAHVKPQTKATYQSKLNHARAFFGDSVSIFGIGQACWRRPKTDPLEVRRKTWTDLCRKSKAFSVF